MINSKSNPFDLLDKMDPSPKVQFKSPKSGSKSQPNAQIKTSALRNSQNKGSKPHDAGFDDLKDSSLDNKIEKKIFSDEDEDEEVDDFSTPLPEKDKKNFKNVKMTPHPNKGTLPRNNLDAKSRSVMDKLSQKSNSKEVIPEEGPATKTPHPNKGVLERGHHEVLDELAGKGRELIDKASEKVTISKTGKKLPAHGTPHPNKRKLNKNAVPKNDIIMNNKHSEEDLADQKPAEKSSNKGFFAKFKDEIVNFASSTFSFGKHESNDVLDKGSEKNEDKSADKTSDKRIKFANTQTVHKFNVEDPVISNKNKTTKAKKRVSIVEDNEPQAMN